MRWLNGARYQNLFFYGDSLTVGASATAGQTYPAQLVAMWPRGRWYFNGGVGGDTSSQILTRYLAADASYQAGTLVIWSGRNNYNDAAQVKADIAAMVAAHAANGGGSRYLVLSIINGDYGSEYLGQSNWQLIVNLNADLATTYGERFVDVRGPLVQAGSPSGIAPNPTDYAHDIPPSEIRTDNVHLTNSGYGIVAAEVYAKLVEFGW